MTEPAWTRACALPGERLPPTRRPRPATGEEPPLAATREKPVQQRRPSTAKVNKHINKKLHIKNKRRCRGFIKEKKKKDHFASHVCSCHVLLFTSSPAPPLAHTGPHWVLFSSEFLPGQTLHFPYRLSCFQPPLKKIPAITHPTLSLMWPTFNNCSVPRIQDFPCHFPGPPAISLRQTLFLLLFSVHFISVIQTPSGTSLSPNDTI